MKLSTCSLFRILKQVRPFYFNYNQQIHYCIMKVRCVCYLHFSPAFRKNFLNKYLSLRDNNVYTLFMVYILQTHTISSRIPRIWRSLQKKENVSLTLRIIVSNKRYNKRTLYSYLVITGNFCLWHKAKWFF